MAFAAHAVCIVVVVQESDGRERGCVDNADGRRSAVQGIAV